MSYLSLKQLIYQREEDYRDAYMRKTHIMRNAGLEEAQAGIKIAGRNINKLRYADDTAIMQKVKRN